MLVLAVHKLAEASAKVPFSMVVLLDCVSKKLHPPEFKCRQIVPTSGLTSISLWDAPDLEALREWLDELMEADCKSEVFEVQEQFAIGLFADVHRAADEVSAKTRVVGSAASAQFGKLDERFKIQDQAKQAMKVAGDMGAVAAQNTRKVAGDVGTFAKSMSNKAMENEKVATAAQTTAQAWRGMTDKVTTSFKSFNLGGGLWPAAGAGGAASGSPHAQTQSSAGRQADDGPRLVDNSWPASSPPAPTAETMPTTTAAGAPVVAPKPAAPHPTSTNQSDLFSLGDEDDAALSPAASTQAKAAASSPPAVPAKSP
jgi:hypothetical protein